MCHMKREKCDVTAVALMRSLSVMKRPLLILPLFFTKGASSKSWPRWILDYPKYFPIDILVLKCYRSPWMAFAWTLNKLRSVYKKKCEPSVILNGRLKREKPWIVSMVTNFVSIDQFSSQCFQTCSKIIIFLYKWANRKKQSTVHRCQSIIFCTFSLIVPTHCGSPLSCNNNCYTWFWGIMWKLIINEELMHIKYTEGKSHKLFELVFTSTTLGR